MAVTILRAEALSNSTVAGTTVVDIQAATGYEITEWTCFAVQTNSANIQMRITVTYSDATTTVVDSTAATHQRFLMNAGGIIRLNFTAGAVDQITALSSKPVTRIQVTTLSTGTTWKTAAVAGTQRPLGSRSVKRAGGSSTAAAGTIIADISADAGEVLKGWSVFAGQTAIANTAHRIVVTYLDATTTTSDSAVNTSAHQEGNAGGAIRIVSNAANQLTAFSAKDVVRVRVETLGTSAVGTRYAAVAGTSVPLADQPILKSQAKPRATTR